MAAELTLPTPTPVGAGRRTSALPRSGNGRERPWGTDPGRLRGGAALRAGVQGSERRTRRWPELCRHALPQGDPSTEPSTIGARRGRGPAGARFEGTVNLEAARLRRAGQGPGQKTLRRGHRRRSHIREFRRVRQGRFAQK